MHYWSLKYQKSHLNQRIRQEGIRKEGIQKEGIQKEGIQKEGIQKEGIQKEGIQKEGIRLKLHCLLLSALYTQKWGYTHLQLVDLVPFKLVYAL